MAVTLVGFYLAYEKITKPPRNLRHIPQASFFKYLKGLLTQCPYDEVAEEITVPMGASTDHGLYIVSVRFCLTC